MARRRENWRERARRYIEAYPALLKEDAELKECKITPAYTGMPGGGGSGRTTENAAMRQLAPKYQRQLDAVRLAISTTERYRNAKERLRVIELVYWEQTHDLHGAALKCNYSYESAKRWNAAFIELVDAYYRAL